MVSIKVFQFTTFEDFAPYIVSPEIIQEIL